MKRKSRYFKVTTSKGEVSIWETNAKKTKERLLFTSVHTLQDLEKMRKIWTPCSGIGQSESEVEITEAEAFAEML